MIAHLKTRKNTVITTYCYFKLTNSPTLFINVIKMKPYFKFLFKD